MKLEQYITPLILAGGRGTRLSPVVKDRPKPLAMVKGRPFLIYLIELLKKSNFKRVIICTGFKGHMFPDLLGDRYQDTELVYSKENQPLGTGGAVVQALRLIRTKYILILNGDSYLHCNLESLLHRIITSAGHSVKYNLSSLAQSIHKNSRQGKENGPWTKPDSAKTGNKTLPAAISPAAGNNLVPVPPVLFVTWKEETGRYGRVEIDKEQRIMEFREKGDNPGPGWINAGIYLLPKDIFASYQTGQSISMETEIFPQLLKKGLFACCCPGSFVDIGTPESFARADEFFTAINTSSQKGQDHV